MHGRPYHPADPGQDRAVPRHAEGRAVPVDASRPAEALRRRPGGLASGLQRDPSARGLRRRTAVPPVASRPAATAGGGAGARVPGRLGSASRRPGGRDPLASCADPGGPWAGRSAGTRGRDAGQGRVYYDPHRVRCAPVASLNASHRLYNGANPVCQPCPCTAQLANLSHPPLSTVPVCAHYESEADLKRQAIAPAVGISQTQAFLDGGSSVSEHVFHLDHSSKLELTLGFLSC